MEVREKYVAIVLLRGQLLSIPQANIVGHEGCLMRRREVLTKVKFLEASRVNVFAKMHRHYEYRN